MSGRNYEKYGGNTTCIQITTRKEDVLFIDAGTGIRELGNHLLQTDKTHIHLLLTHFHWDHIQGLPYFKPAYRENVRIDVYGRPPAGWSLQSCVESVLVPPHFPLSPAALKADIQYHPIQTDPFKIGETLITPVFLNHPNGGVGYKISGEEKSFVFLTDNELRFPHPARQDFRVYVDFVRKADLLIHDAEFMPDEYESRKGWGHSSVDDAVRLAVEAEVGQLGLFHHNQDRTDQELDKLVRHAQELAESSPVNCFGVKQGMEIEL